MAFKFNFLQQQDSNQNQASVVETRKPVVVEGLVVAEEVSSGVLTLTEAERVAIVKGDHERIPYSLPGNIEIFMLNGSEIANRDQVARATDVLPGQYEGGFKIWECSFDAIKYLNLTKQPVRFLDLGCGSGVVGIWALKHWPDTLVSFHDLNQSVLKQATIPNISCNDPTLLRRSTFFYGPWKTSAALITAHGGRYDLISTADTLYDPQAITDLHDLLVDILQPGGSAIISAKRYYFGVGGGVASFVKLAQDRGLGVTRVLASYEDGASNIRDVLEFCLAAKIL